MFQNMKIIVPWKFNSEYEIKYTHKCIKGKLHHKMDLQLRIYKLIKMTTIHKNTENYKFRENSFNKEAFH